ncbi:MAG: hypothetical protein JWO59_1803 [Chloroflexi bacterium]|nr:hypothetical protein [Chloroflexota bacterium]
MRAVLPPSRSEQAQAGAWASRLAQCRTKGAGEPAATRPDKPHEDIGVLWALLDDAVTNANVALAEAGLAERITMQGPGSERCYILVEADGEERTISISVALPEIVGHEKGGVFIGLGRTRLSIFLVPETHGADTRWLVATDGTEFTADLVHDIFLSVFGDDSAATFRLSPLGGSNLFQTPWS